MKPIAIIPARSGSKGIKDKNILFLAGKPLLAWTILAALESKKFSHVYVSTDSALYADIATRYGAEALIRPRELAGDTSTTFDVLSYLFKEEQVSNFSYFVLLQPTSPFRGPTHIEDACNLFEEKQKQGFDFLVSLRRSQSNPDLLKPLAEDGSLANFDADFKHYRRQNSSLVEPNGAIFIGTADAYLKNGHFFGKKSYGFLMDEDSSIDIDNKNDFELALVLASKNARFGGGDQRISGLVKNQIDLKFSKEWQKSPLVLLGDSNFAFWNANSIDGCEVNNFGIPGIDSKTFFESIISKNLITDFGTYCFLLFGTNDIVLGASKEALFSNLSLMIQHISLRSPRTKIFVLSIPKTIGRMDRNNDIIDEYNRFLSASFGKDRFVELNKLNNICGSLSDQNTKDGLHLNDSGYSILENEIRARLS